MSHRLNIASASGMLLSSWIRTATLLACCLGSTSAAEPAAEVRRVTFIITQHVILHERQIVSWEDVERILDNHAERGKIRPQFLFTTGGIRRNAEVREQYWKLYKKLYDAGKTDGMTVGSLSPRGSERLDRIKEPEDLVPDRATTLFGRVLDMNGESKAGVEVFLLPEEHVNGVYLQDGRLRNRYDEYCVTSKSDGSFVMYPGPEDKLIVAVHPHGFVTATLTEFRKTGHLQLKRWARVWGTRPTGGNDAKQQVHFTSYPVPGLSFSVYETEFNKQGEFDQRYVPPGDVVISRAIPVGDGVTRSFAVERSQLEPGTEHNVTLGPIPERVNNQLDR